MDLIIYWLNDIILGIYPEPAYVSLTFTFLEYFKTYSHWNIVKIENSKRLKMVHYTPIHPGSLYSVVSGQTLPHFPVVML